MGIRDAVRSLSVLARNWDEPFGLLITVHDQSWSEAAERSPSLAHEVSGITVLLESYGASFREIRVQNDFTWKRYCFVH